MKVVSINDVKKTSEDNIKEELAKRKEAMLDVVDHIRQGIESGEIVEFVATSLDTEGESQIHCYIGDVAVGIGLYEIGKSILMNQYEPKDNQK